MSWSPFVVLRVRFWLVAHSAGLLLACGADQRTTPEDHDFADQHGRKCVARLEKTSPSAPSVKETVSCDGVAKECSSESQACFALSLDRDNDQMLNCPACCKGTAVSFATVECSPLGCSTDADCVYTKAECHDGSCFCPTGYCE